ncbi:hypothetical protein ACJJI3_12535 [Microbulbifer sp. ZKSA004]|uniref:hypothetical protein n=1 Tax=Microbulbifer sp. ZKSA004 TaxID=3243389 RepID=UPI004039CFB2
MKFSRLLIVVSVLFLSKNTYAGWTTEGVVEQVISHNGLHLIHTTISDTTCASTGKFWWPADDSDAKDMLSIALAALMSGKKVTLVHDTDTPDCRLDNFNKATHMSIKN